MKTQFLVPCQRELLHAFDTGFRVVQSYSNAGQCFMDLNKCLGEDEDDLSTIFYYFPSFATSYYHHGGGTCDELLNDLCVLFRQVAHVTRHALTMLRNYIFMFEDERGFYASFVERYEAAKHELRAVELACCRLRDFEYRYLRI